MNLFKLFMAAICIAAFFSCKNNSASQSATPDLKAMVNSLAEVECRAVSLREQRFALANKIRFAQDTLMQTKGGDTMRLHNSLVEMNTQKQTLQQQSFALADSIKHHLDSLFQHHLADTALKHRFSNELNDVLVKRGCIEKE